MKQTKINRKSTVHPDKTSGSIATSKNQPARSEHKSHNPPTQTIPPQQPSVARSTLVMSIATMLSRITGFARTWAMAAALGAGAAASAYSTANNVPNMIFELVAGGILSSVFIPTFMDVRKRRGDKAAWRFASHLFTLCTLALGLVAIIGTLLPSPFMWTQYFLPGRTATATNEVRMLADFFFRFFALQVVIYGIGMIIGAVLNAQRKFFWTSIAPVFNNLVVIAVMLFASRLPLNTATYRLLGIGTTLGVALMFVVMLPALKKTGFRFKLELDLRDPDLRAMFKLALPTLAYVITNLVAVSVRNAAAGAISVDGQAYVAYANIWSNLPYGILAVSVATAFFTELSHHATDHDLPEFKRSFTRGLSATTLLMLPTSALLFGLAQPLISLYVGGRMKADSIAPITAILQTWAVTLVFYAGMMFVLRAFYALKDTKTVAIANFFCTLLQVGGYILLTGSLAGAPAGFGIVGIPLADGIFYLALFVTLLVVLRKKIGSFDLRQLVRSFLKTGSVSVAVAICCLVLVGVLTPHFGSGRVGALLVTLVTATCGIAVILVLAHLLRIEEITALAGKVTARLPIKKKGRNTNNEPKRKAL